MSAQARGILEAAETAAAESCLRKVLSEGASMARITLEKGVSSIVSILDGSLDKVTHCLDRSLQLNLSVDGRRGAFSTNRLDPEGLEAFAVKAVRTARMLAPDPLWALPSQDRVEKNAATGLELGLYDPAWETLTPEKRLGIALSASISGRAAESPTDGRKKTGARQKTQDATLISEEGEYSDGVTDTLVLDSNGTRCRHTETTFGYAVEVTVADRDGNRLSGYWWDATPRLEDLRIADCGRIAFRRASEMAGARRMRSRRCNMVIDTEVASRLVTPLLNVLGGSAIQQRNSFLEGSLGKRLFSEGLTIIDDCRTPGCSGCHLFDNEGVATTVHPVIEKGVVREYFLGTYTAAKLGMAPTVSDITRPRIPGWPRSGMNRDDLLRECGEGILVTAFNGGNFNRNTGDFSYGIEGFSFKDGKIVRPVREMLMTGNFLTLWKDLLAAGEDARPCANRLIPSLAFTNVNFSG